MSAAWYVVICAAWGALAVTACFTVACAVAVGLRRKSRSRRR